MQTQNHTIPAIHATRDTLLTKDQLASQLGISRRGIEQLVSARRIPVIRLGHKTVRFSWPKVEAALAKLETREI